MRVIKRPGLMWYQGTVDIADGGTNGTTVAEALTNLGYIPSSSLGQPLGTVPLSSGVIPKQYLPVSNLGAAAVMGAVRMMVASQRTLSITNFDSFEAYSITAKYGSVGTLSVAGATAGDFIYTAPSSVPAAGYDSITINGINFDIEILSTVIDTPTITSPVENYSGELSAIGTFTSSAYSAGSAVMVDAVTIGGAGSFTVPATTEKIRVVNRSNASVVVSQAGTTKTVPANSVLEWAGTGTWIYSVIVGRVLVEFLKGSNSHASSDWQIATDLQFTNIVKQSLADTVNRVSWANSLTEAGIYYVRVRHRDSAGNTSSWSAARRIAPTGAPTRQTSYTTSWVTGWWTNWSTAVAGAGYNTSTITTSSGTRNTFYYSNWGGNRLTSSSGSRQTSGPFSYTTLWTTSETHMTRNWWQTAVTLMTSATTSYVTSGYGGGAEGGGNNSRTTSYTTSWYYNGTINTYSDSSETNSLQTGQITNRTDYWQTSWTSSWSTNWSTSVYTYSSVSSSSSYTTTWTTYPINYQQTSGQTSQNTSNITSKSTLI